MHTTRVKITLERLKMQTKLLKYIYEWSCSGSIYFNLWNYTENEMLFLNV